MLKTQDLSPMKNKPVCICCLLILLLSSCTTNKMSGLWVVEKVTVGEEEMTPIARWMKFNKDRTQESGNGWVQHSIGSWNYDRSDKTLQITNSNGFKDSYGPFLASIEKEKMTWQRKEEGQTVTVSLKRSNSIPAAPANKLLGVWDLVKAEEDGKDITKDLDPHGKRYLFIRWDHLFTVQHSPEGRISGFYQVNGHQPVIEFIHSGKETKRSQWSFEVEKESLILKTRDSPKSKKLKRIYKRIDYFPQ